MTIKQRVLSRTGQFWIGILISVLCVAGVLWVVDLDRVVEALREADWLLIVGAVAAGQAAFLVLRAKRWQIMLSGVEIGAGQDQMKVGFGAFFYAQNVGYLINNLLPFRLGDLARSYIIGQQPGGSGFQALSSVALERILDMLMMVVFFGIAAPLAPALPEGIRISAILFSIAAAAGFICMILAAIYRQRVVGLFQRVLEKTKVKDTETWIVRTGSFLDGFKTLTNLRMFVASTALTILLWVCIVAAYYLGLLACWPGVTWPAALITLCAAAFGVSAPSSPASVGVFHGAVVLGLSVFPLSREAALSFAVLYHATMFLVNLILGLWGLFKSGQTLSGILAGVKEMQGK